MTKNYPTWQYQAWLTIQTLSVEDHLDPTKTSSKLATGNDESAKSVTQTTIITATDAQPRGTPTLTTTSVSLGCVKKTRTIDEYLTKISAILESLAAASYTLSDDDHI
ncbi:hypothetical protein PIB30_056192 [Stylosanthes scabra]|uniref:Uncharacterized protein n=1 Tax=Stylosanthes scabra TaxID=79078 RepID=A0ABU6VI81_9FABA|nr:hypothetical protein [Stylosanthes scabra]